MLAHQSDQSELQAAEALYRGSKSNSGSGNCVTILKRCPATISGKRKARVSLEDELDRALAGTIAKLLSSTDPTQQVSERLAHWQTDNTRLLSHFQATCDEVNAQDAPNLAMLSVAVSELSLLY